MLHTHIPVSGTKWQQVQCRSNVSVQFTRQKYVAARRSLRNKLFVHCVAENPGLEIPKVVYKVSKPEKQQNELFQKVANVFQPLSDPEANRKVVALAVGGMLCSVATLVHDCYLPIYMKDVLHLNNTKIGQVQALSMFICQLSNGVSGIIGDLLKSQVKVLVFGMVLTLLCKPMFALSGSVYALFGASATLWWITLGKLSDRMSKGIREAPTKSLMKDISVQSGDAPDAVFSLRQGLATAGALIGSIAASAFFIASGKSYVVTFAAASIPAALALIWILASFSSSSQQKQSQEINIQATETGSNSSSGINQQQVKQKVPFGRKVKALLSSFQPVYWQALAVVCILFFARFDFSFVSLRAKLVMEKSYLPALVTTTMLGTTLFSLITGSLMKGGGVVRRNLMLGVGISVLILANIIFSLPMFGNVYGMFIGTALIGVHMGMTHGLCYSMVSSYFPHNEVEGIGKITGSAWSFTDLLLGFVLAASNTLAGRLADVTEKMGMGPIGCFGGGGAACTIALAALVLFSIFGDLGKQDLVVKTKK
eukprot:TRINITY_DN6276_c1_g1_i2.p1 TRINITY_DN6276_c1_g1~~TRINITY_DN6276_c1_g1_i2.p1  ORF type:complete len:553 (-),score=35.37 TRINITY_DN6276_c1_g1_i2:618-2234(-)